MTGNDASADEGRTVPARLTSEQVDTILRRAVELQAAASAGGDVLDEEDLLRIGREVGIDAVYLSRAIAETAGGSEPDRGWLRRVMGSRSVSASRTVSLPAERARDELDRYLREEEFMVVQRRFPGRVRYSRASGLAADVGRIASDMSRRHPRLNAPELEITVREAGKDSSFVALHMDLAGKRAGLVSGGIVTGGGSAAVLGLALALTVAPPAALLGVPVLAGSMWGSRRIYRRTLQGKHRLLESVLDRLEHGELRQPRPAWRRLLEG